MTFGASAALANLGAMLLVLYAAVLISRKALSSARREAERFRAVLEMAPNGIVTIAADGTIGIANERADDMFGYPVGGLIGLDCDQLFDRRFASDLKRDPKKDLVPHGHASHAQELSGRKKSGEAFTAQVTLSTATDDEPQTLLIIRDITEVRRRDSLLTRLAEALIHSTNAVAIANADGRVIFVNPAYEEMSGQPLVEIVGQPLLTLRPDRPECAQTWSRIESGAQWSGRASPRALEPKATSWEAMVSPMLDEEGSLTGIFEIWQDRRDEVFLEQRLAQAQKLETVGELAAGIAHEINTPVQFVGDNLRFLRDRTTDLLQMGGGLAAVLVSAREGSLTEELLRELEERCRSADLEYMVDEIPRAIEQSLEGVEHVATIVRAMKAYSHPSVEMAPSDLNAAIANAITVSRNEWKYVAEVVANLDPTLPAVTCAPGQFNQVMLNLIVNAAHAIEAHGGETPRTKGLIAVASRWTDEYVEVTVEDDGCGIEPEDQARIFEPFFTTKEVGRGTGQGLSMVRHLIVKNHGGSIDVTSSPGEGSCFTIRMPLDTDEREAVA